MSRKDRKFKGFFRPKLGEDQKKGDFGPKLSEYQKKGLQSKKKKVFTHI